MGGMLDPRADLTGDAGPGDIAAGFPGSWLPSREGPTAERGEGSV
jgi:hypothetical protein